VTSVDLVNVFAHRAYSIGRGLNLSTHEAFKTALKTAEERDEERNKAIQDGTVEDLGAFHGIPIGVQDSLN